jgi:hypothetical protein
MTVPFDFDVTFPSSILQGNKYRLFNYNAEINGQQYNIIITPEAIPLFNLISAKFIEVEIHAYGTGRKATFPEGGNWKTSIVFSTEPLKGDKVKVEIVNSKYKVIRHDKVSYIRRNFFRWLSDKYGRVIDIPEVRELVGTSFIDEIKKPVKLHSAKYVKWLTDNNAELHDVVINDGYFTETFDFYRVGRVFAWEDVTYPSATYIFFTDDIEKVKEIVLHTTKKLAMIDPEFHKLAGVRIERLIHKKNKQVERDEEWEEIMTTYLPK